MIFAHQTMRRESAGDGHSESQARSSVSLLPSPEGESQILPRFPTQIKRKLNIVGQIQITFLLPCTLRFDELRWAQSQKLIYTIRIHTRTVRQRVPTGATANFTVMVKGALARSVGHRDSDRSDWPVDLKGRLWTSLLRSSAY